MTAPTSLPGLPPCAWYFPEFVTEAEEAYLVRKIAESPLPRWKPTPTGRRLQYLGGTLTKNNLLIPEALPDYVTQFPDLITRITQTTHVFHSPSPSPSSSDSDSGAGAPNQVLVNEYTAGQGIAPHEDGPAYHPAVATLSLSSPQCVEIYQYLSTTDPSPPLTTTPAPSDPTAAHGKPIAAVPLARVYLEPRSLFIISSSLYQSHLHGIASTTEDILTASTDVPIANLHLVSPAIQETIASTGEYRSPRGTRVSMTFRKVARVMRAGALGGLKKGGGGR